MKLRSTLLCAAALLIPLAACGGSDDNNSGPRPSTSELESSIREAAGFTSDNGGPIDQVVSCMAREIHASDIPNGVVRKVAAGEDAEVDRSNEDRYNQILEDITNQCAGG